MPARTNPSARQVRLGTELRRLRERAGRTAREVAGLFGTDQGKVSNMESGRIGVSEDRIRRLAAFCNCDDGALVDALCEIARERRGQFWWDEFRGLLPPGFLDLAELEHHAVSLCSAHTVTVPGLLQTEEYSRTLFSADTPKIPNDEVDARVAHRARRRELLEGESPTPFEAVVHEAALRMRFGGRKVARDQLEFLVDASEWPSVTLRVLPFTNEEYIEATHATLHAQGAVRQLDTVHMDSPLGGGMLDAEAQVEKYRAVLRRATRAAVDPDESRQLIRQIAREL